MKILWLPSLVISSRSVASAYDPSHHWISRRDREARLAMDLLTRSQRSAVMSAVKSKDTVPELTVRKLIHGLGYRYRLHGKGLPGKPDLVFRGRQAIIFIHGCFWHRHPGCALARLPKSRIDFWEPKLSANRLRDRRNERALRTQGWRVLVIWECQIAKTERLIARIRRFLDA